MAQRKPKDAGGPGKAKKTSPAPKAEDKRVYFKQSDFPRRRFSRRRGLPLLSLTTSQAIPARHQTLRSL